MNAAPVAYTAATAAFNAGRMPVVPKGASLAATKKAAQAFEGFFLSQMLEAMFKDVPMGGMFGAGPGAGIYRSMMLQEYGKEIAKGGGIGIADMVTREMMQVQEKR